MSYNTQLVNDQLTYLVDLFSSSDATKLKDTITKTYIQGLGKPLHKWSLGNQILVYLQKTTDARTLNQWRKVGRHIKKGSKCIYILSPVNKKIESKNKETNEIESMYILSGFKGLPVFKYEDTYGAGLKKYEPNKQLKLKEVADKWNLKIEYDSSLHGEFGSFSLLDNKIRLCTEDQTTFFHELIHKAHSKIETLKAGQDPEQETIAQLGACVLGLMYGFDVKEYTFNYIASYVQSKDPQLVGKMCLRVLSKVQKILNLILEEANPDNKILCEVKNK